MEAPDSSVGGENRKARRLKADLDVNLSTDTSILIHSPDYTAESFPLSLSGYTANISEGGLALIVPSFHVDEEFCRDGKKTLRIGLALPTEPVTLQASPVHCKPLDRSDPGQGYLLGVRIMRMDARDQERYRSYLSMARRDK